MTPPASARDLQLSPIAGTVAVGYRRQFVSPAMPTDVAILTDDPIDDLIAALNTFEPARDDTDNVVRLYDIFRDFRVLPQRDRAMPAMFSLLERFPDAEFGSPGPLVQEVEAIPGYLPLLRDSLHRQPVHLTVWMANRLLNTELPADQREAWLSELRAALRHPLASEQTRRFAEEFLSHQKGNS